MDFKICYPDANTIDSVIKVKSLEDFNAEYFDLGEGIGYWIADNPFYDNGFELFKGVVKSFPIVKDNNAEGNLDPNPFDTIHLPDWTYKHICFLLRDFYLKHVQIVYMIRKYMNGVMCITKKEQSLLVVGAYRMLIILKD